MANNFLLFHVFQSQTEKKRIFATPVARLSRNIVRSGANRRNANFKTSAGKQSVCPNLIGVVVCYLLIELGGWALKGQPSAV